MHCTGHADCRDIVTWNARDDAIRGWTPQSSVSVESGKSAVESTASIQQESGTNIRVFLGIRSEAPFSVPKRSPRSRYVPKRFVHIASQCSLSEEIVFREELQTLRDEHRTLSRRYDDVRSELDVKSSFFGDMSHKYDEQVMLIEDLRARLFARMHPIKKVAVVHGQTSYIVSAAMNFLAQMCRGVADVFHSNSVRVYQLPKSGGTLLSCIYSTDGEMEMASFRMDGSHPLVKACRLHMPVVRDGNFIIPLMEDRQQCVGALSILLLEELSEPEMQLLMIIGVVMAKFVGFHEQLFAERWDVKLQKVLDRYYDDSDVDESFSPWLMIASALPKSVLSPRRNVLDVTADANASPSPSSSPLRGLKSAPTCTVTCPAIADSDPESAQTREEQEPKKEEEI
jgi:hypothetical protein